MCQGSAAIHVGVCHNPEFRNSINAKRGFAGARKSRRRFALQLYVLERFHFQVDRAQCGRAYTPRFKG
jgi:hypothetical protein